MNFYQMKIEQISQDLKTNIETGLSKKEIKSRLEKYGPNTLPEEKPTGPLMILVRQFLSPLMFILLIAATVSFLIGEVTDSIVIAMAVGINTILGFVQEFKAEQAAQKLKTYEVLHCNVRRDGKIISIKAKDLVPGDILLLSAGAKVPADIRLTHVNDFRTDESILTGESQPIKKNIDKIENKVVVGDRFNMTFAGTHVLSGKAEGIVIHTGAKTQLGDIAKLVTETKPSATPLQQQIKKLSWWLGAFFLSVTGLVLILGLAKGMNVYDVIMISIALAVAAIPEGLLVAVTVILAIGMQRMLKRKALVRHLIAAETLGSVSVICTDKTGTLTRGHMEVVKIATKNFDLSMQEIPGNKLDKEIENLLVACILNNDAQLRQDSQKPTGHPTEITLLKAADSLNINIEKTQKQYPRLDEIPFSSAIKYMATVNKFDNHQELIVKGAPEKIFEMCSPNNERFQQIAQDMTQQGLRTLAIAQKVKNDIDIKKDLNNLDCIGVIGIQDPLRPEATSTVKELKNAGISIILVTGDHKDTAANIAKHSGIIHRKNGIITGAELDNLTEVELEEKIQDIDVFARVEPRHKITIVNAWKALGKSVAMIGDGINDAPAIKAADIGISLGSGSDVTHEISDMVLLDDNLKSIDEAVKEGRKIFDNIRKVITYLLTDCFGEIILICFAILFGFPLPILATQILYINLMSDGLPYLALTVEPAEPEIMKEPPRPKNEFVLNKEMKTIIFVTGIITDIILFIFYVILLKTNLNLKHVQTIIFTTLAINSLFFAFSVRSLRKYIFKINLFSNPLLIFAFLGSFLMQLFVIYLPPLQRLFSTIPLGFFDWSLILPLSFVKVIAIEITKKWFIVKDEKNKNFLLNKKDI
jgi:P-type Ca2+ transporter type 2C